MRFQPQVSSLLIGKAQGDVFVILLSLLETDTEIAQTSEWLGD